MSAREVAEQIANNLPWLEDKAAQDYEGAVKEIMAMMDSGDDQLFTAEQAVVEAAVKVRQDDPEDEWDLLPSSVKEAVDTLLALRKEGEGERNRD